MATNTTNLFKDQCYTEYSIWPSRGATAKEAAEAFFKDKRTATAYTQKSITQIKTSAGDSGWLVESESYITFGGLDPAILKNAKASGLSVQLVPIEGPTQKIPIIYHEFFFHSGSLGSIRVEIMTQSANPSWRSQLDQVVLQTLQFNGN
jgi:hypothetical protein